MPPSRSTGAKSKKPARNVFQAIEENGFPLCDDEEEMAMVSSLSATQRDNNRSLDPPDDSTSSDTETTGKQGANKQSSTRYADAARRAVTEAMLECAPPPPPGRPPAQSTAASSGSAQRSQEPEDIDWPEVRGPNGILLLASDRQRNVPPTTERLCSSDYQDADSWMKLAEKSRTTTFCARS